MYMSGSMCRLYMHAFTHTSAVSLRAPEQGSSVESSRGKSRVKKLPELQTKGEGGPREGITPVLYPNGRNALCISSFSLLPPSSHPSEWASGQTTVVCEWHGGIHRTQAEWTQASCCRPSAWHTPHTHLRRASMDGTRTLGTLRYASNYHHLRVCIREACGIRQRTGRIWR